MKAQLVNEGWRTPDTWDGEDFERLPPEPGLYVLIAVDMSDGLYRRKICYVGKSLNLARRLIAHSVVREIQNQGPAIHVQRWFRAMPATRISDAEIETIGRFDPLLNIQHRRRDIVFGPQSAEFKQGERV